jgi:hypothetical protein
MPTAESTEESGEKMQSAAPAAAPKLPLLRRRSVQAALLCLAAFGTAAAVALAVFQGMPHLEDEQADFFQARVFAAGLLAAPETPDKDAFFVPFVIVRGGLRFAKYTPGYPLVLALGVLLGAPWVINALASALALLGVFLLGRDLFGADAGLLAAALGAVSPAFVLLSGTYLPHPATMAALVLFAWALLRARRPGEPHPVRFSLPAGALLGFAVLARPWTAFAVAAPFIGLGMIDFGRAVIGRIAARRGAGRKPARENGRAQPRPFLYVYIPLIVACLAVCAFLPFYNWAVTGSPFTNTYTLWWPYDTVGFGAAYGRLGGHTLELGLLNAKLDLSAFQTALLGWPVPLGVPLVALPLLLGLALAPRSRNDLLILLPPAALILAHLAYWARAGEFFGGRYYSEGMPFLWLLAARGLLKFAAGKWRLRLVRAALPVFLAWSIAFQILPRLIQGRGLYGIRREPVDAVAAADLHNALVFIRIRTWADYATFSWLDDPALAGDVIYLRDLGRNADRGLIGRFPNREVYLFDMSEGENRLIRFEP